MCYGCYEEAGEPKIVNERTIKAVELIKEVYDSENGGAGGYGHIVFDDWNIQDENIDSCIYDANEGTFSIGDEETKQKSLAALKYFRELSEDERYSVLAIIDGFLKI